MGQLYILLDEMGLDETGLDEMAINQLHIYRCILQYNTMCKKQLEANK